MNRIHFVSIFFVPFILNLISISAWGQNPSPSPSPSPLGAQPAMRGAEGPSSGAVAAALGFLGIGAPRRASVNYSGSYAPWLFRPEQRSDVQSHRLLGMVPVYQNESDSLALSMNSGLIHFSESQTINDSNPVSIENLWRFEFGAQYSHQKQDGSNLGGRFALGSASNHIYSGTSTATINGLAFYGFQPGERSRWMITLFFSNNSPIINYVPIPGFVYVYRGERVTALLGAPFALLQWNFLNTESVPWYTVVSFMGPTMNLEIARGDFRGLQIYSGIGWIQQSFLREERKEFRDRLFWDEKRAQLGVRLPLMRALASDWQVGYSFDRFLYEGRRVGDRDAGAASLASAWFAGWNLRLQF